MTVVGVLCYQKGSFCASKDSLSAVSSHEKEKVLEMLRTTSGGAGALCIFLQGLRCVGIGCVCAYAWCQL